MPPTAPLHVILMTDLELDGTRSVRIVGIAASMERAARIKAEFAIAYPHASFEIEEHCIVDTAKAEQVSDPHLVEGLRELAKVQKGVTVRSYMCAAADRLEHLERELAIRREEERR